MRRASDEGETRAMRVRRASARATSVRAEQSDAHRWGPMRMIPIMNFSPLVPRALFWGFSVLRILPLRILPKNYDPKQAAGRERSRDAGSSSSVVRCACGTRLLASRRPSQPLLLGCGKGADDASAIELRLHGHLIGRAAVDRGGCARSGDFGVLRGPSGGSRGGPGPKVLAFGSKGGV